MDNQLIIWFILATLTLAFMPGPDNIYVLTESIAKGPRQGIFITLGLMSGVIVHTTLVATGLSVLVFSNPIGFMVVQYAGAAYLFYLAYQAVKEEQQQVVLSTQGEASPASALLKRGFTMNVLNPKVSVFFIAFLPQFVAQDGWPPFVQMIVLGGLFALTSFFVFAGIAMVSGRSARMVQSPVFWSATKWIKVVVLLALGLLLLFAEQ
jgi:threonine/homoserine/homoserine lactone efflux protein